MGDIIGDVAFAGEATAGMTEALSLRLKTLGALVDVSTGVRWEPSKVEEPLKQFLSAWDEPEHTFYDPYNYAQLVRGKFHSGAYPAVPVVVALGGLFRHSRNIVPENGTMGPIEQFGRAIRVFHDHIGDGVDGQSSSRRETVRFTRQGLRLIEGLGVTSFLDQNLHARAMITNSHFFNRKELRDIYL